MQIINILVNLFYVIAIVDAANIFTGVKSKLFILVLLILFLTSKTRLYFKYFKMFCVVIAISIFCFICGRLYGYDYDIQFFSQYLLGFSMLLLLIWQKYYDVESGMWIASYILAYGVIAAYFACFINPAYSSIVLSLASNKEGTDIIYISQRSFLGYDFSGVFYTPLMFVVIPCSISIYRLFYFKGEKLKNLYMALLFTTALFCGGNRACLMCIAILWMLIGGYSFLIRHKFLLHVMLPIMLALIIILFETFNSEDELSNRVKSLHIITYERILKENPLVYLTGMGAGSLVYTLGFEKKVPLMEWTYLELVRMFGIFSLYIIYIYYKPVLFLYRNKQFFKYGLPVAAGCFVYMVSSYANPYLINSTGFCVLIYLYSYIEKRDNRL